MTNTFFISDTHFGHKNIIKYEAEARPFTTIEDMHEEMIKRWNSVVRAGDKVIHAGDFCFGAKWVEIARRLNGMKYLVLGNHDNYTSASYMRFFHKLLGAMEFDGNIITHIPVHEAQLERYKANIHGHLHSQNIMRQPHPMRGYILDNRYWNVSCEQINLTPISYEELKEKYDN